MKYPIQHIKEFLYGTPLRRTSDGTYDGINFNLQNKYINKSI